MAELLCRATDPEWAELRRAGVTATDITVIAGLVSWDSPWALFWRKRGILPPVEQTDRMRLGSWLEDSIAAYWSVRYYTDSIPVPAGLFASSDRPWQMATPDRVSDGEPVECKSWATRDGWGDDGSDQVPDHIRAQVLWQMDTLGVARGHVAVVFLPSGEFRSYAISHIDAEIDHLAPVGGHPFNAEIPECPVCADQAKYRALGLEFYRRLAGELPPPDVDGMAATTAGLKARYASPESTLRAELPPALIDAWEDANGSLRVARAILKDAEDDRRHAENTIREALANAVVGTVDGKPVIERRFTKRAGYTVEPTELDQLKPIKEGDDA